jgi:hypothetical protein
MTVPEASMYEDDHTIFGEHKVGAAGQRAVLETIAQPSCMQSAADQHFRLGVTPADAAHVEPTLLRS